MFSTLRGNGGHTRAKPRVATMRGTDLHLIRLQRNLHMYDSQPSPATMLLHCESLSQTSHFLSSRISNPGFGRILVSLSIRTFQLLRKRSTIIHVKVQGKSESILHRWYNKTTAA